jgi:transposase
VHVVHPLKVTLIAESTKKTDRIDAQWLAHLLRIGGATGAGTRAQSPESGVRGLLVARRQLVHMRTRLVNVVRGMARQQRIELRSRALRTQGGGTSWPRRTRRPRCGRWWHALASREVGRGNR